nr:MAG TPA: hypothetical protein [Inoviridae sp.]
MIPITIALMFVTSLQFYLCERRVAVCTPIRRQRKYRQRTARRNRENRRNSSITKHLRYFISVWIYYRFILYPFEYKVNISKRIYVRIGDINNIGGLNL